MKHRMWKKYSGGQAGSRSAAHRSGPRQSAWTWAALGSLMVAVGVGCAPATAPLADPPVWSEAERTQICLSRPQIGASGTLMWTVSPKGDTRPADAGEQIERQGGPYLLECPDFRLSHDGQVVTVKARTVQDAYALFDDDAFLMAFYADLRIRLTATGLLVPDPLTEVAEILLDEVATVRVTVQEAGGPVRPLLSGGVATPQQVGTAAVTVQIRTVRTANPWPRVTLDPASGTIIATPGE